MVWADVKIAYICGVKDGRPDGGIGRHEGLKIPWSQDRAGSSPAWGTTKKEHPAWLIGAGRDVLF